MKIETWEDGEGAVLCDEWNERFVMVLLSGGDGRLSSTCVTEDGGTDDFDREKKGGEWFRRCDVMKSSLQKSTRLSQNSRGTFSGVKK